VITAHVNPGVNTYAAALRRLRQGRGLSLRQLGDLLGVSHVFLSDTERGGRPPLSYARTKHALDALGATDEERAELLAFYCEHCGAKRVTAELSHPQPCGIDQVSDENKGDPR
jgi:transcriptional regulator with XRE-family HTH domain